MSTVGGLLVPAVERLRTAGSESPRLDAELLLAHAVGTDRSAIFAFPGAPVGAEAAASFQGLVARREAGEPVAYLRGMRDFHGLALACDARALVPRPETEVLVDFVLADVVDRLGSAPRPPGTSPLAIIDVGTGNGAIALALAAAIRRLGMGAEVEIIASDSSAEACELARENTVGHGLADRVGVIADDLIPAPGAEAGLLTVPGRFDDIAANLPYIRTSDIAGLARDLSFEPREALDGGPDGLAVIRRLIALLPGRLGDDGRAFLEIGADQATAVADEVARSLDGWACHIEVDLAGRPRVAVLERAR